MIYLIIRYHLYTLCKAISNWLYGLNAILNERVLSRRIHSELLILFFQNHIELIYICLKLNAIILNVY